MYLDLERLRIGAKEFHLPLTCEMEAAFAQYAQLLVEYNEKVNLTAITDPEGIAIKHFLDSMLPLTVCELKEGGSIIDVGTGAGFPGIPLKIARPDLSLTLLDSLNKRVVFLQAVSDALKLSANCIHQRAEDGGKDKKLREQYDYATARAVASLRDLAEYCLPFVKVGGLFLALKGYEIEEELAEAQKAISQLGGQVERVEKFVLGPQASRSIVVIKKISQTSTQYPRPAAKMAKFPIC